MPDVILFGDWQVEVFDVAPYPQRDTEGPRKGQLSLNPYTGLPIDEFGITRSLFTMRLTHVPTGHSLERADLTTNISDEWLKTYARDIATNAETHLANQTKRDAGGNVIAPSPLVGALSIAVTQTAREETDDDRAEQAFRMLVRVVLAAQTRLAILIASKSDPTEIADAQSAVDAAQVQVKEAYAPKGVPVSPELAKRFDDAWRSLTTASR